MRKIPSIPSYLRHGNDGIFRFRRAVPRDLQQCLGKTEVVRSLKTRDPRRAVLLGRHLALQADLWFNSVRYDMTKDNKDCTDIETGYKVEVNLFSDGRQQITRETTPEDIAAMKEAGLSGDQIFQLMMNIGSAVPTNAPTEPLQSHMPGAGAQSNAPLLSELIEQYVEDRAAIKKEGWKPYKGEKTKFRRLIEILGDIPITQIGRSEAKMVRQKLRQLPGDTSSYRNMTVNEILAVTHDKKMSAATVKHYMVLYSSLFKWAIKERIYLEANPFESLAPEDTTPANQKRYPFTREDLSKIFSGPQFTSYSPKRDKPHDYWAPLLALFTGARPAEIGALTPYDVFNEPDSTGRDIWCVKINIASEQAKEVRKRAKTASSIRAIPIHPKLIELGFLEYCEYRRAREKKMLFDLTWSQSDGYGRNIRDRFHPYLKTIGVYEKIKKVFYSFRHTMHTELERADTPIHHIERLTGHSYQGAGSVGKRVYITPREAAELYESLSGLKFETELKLVQPFKRSPQLTV